jgi:hypothetical protein
VGVLWVHETWKSRSSALSEQTSITIVDQTGHREYHRSFQVLTDSPYVSPKTVQEAQGLGLPALFASYTNATGTEVDADALARKIEVKADAQNPNLHDVDVLYSTADNPLLEPPDVEWDFVAWQKPVERDALGISIVSSAYGKPDPPLTMDDSRLVCRYTKNELTFDPAVAIAYRDAVNLDFFWGAPPNTAKIASLRGTRQYRSGFLYWRNTYEIHFRRINGQEIGWNLDVLDRDYNFYTRRWAASDVRKKMRATGFDARPTGDPILLNGNGSPLRPLNESEKGAVGTLPNGIAASETQIEIDTGENGGASRFPIDVVAGAGTILTDRGFFELIFGPPGLEEIARVTSVTSFDIGLQVFTVNITRHVGGTPCLGLPDDAPIAQAPYYHTYPVYPVLPFAPLGLIPPS